MRVELSIHAFKLKNVAGFFHGTSDPFAVVTKLTSHHHGNNNNQHPEVIGRTEVIPNTLSPHWTTVFVVDYELGTPFQFAVSIFDENQRRVVASESGGGGTSSNNNNNTPMGSVVFDLGTVLAAHGSTKAKSLTGGGKGTVFVSARKSTGSGTLRFQLQAQELQNVEGWLRKSDPFFELCRHIDLAGNPGWDVVYRSKDVHDDLDPEWEEATIELSFLCGGDLNLPILVRVFDHERSGRHVFMGSVETTVNMLLKALCSDGDDHQGKHLTLTSKGRETGKLYVSLAELAFPQGDPHLESTNGSVLSATKPSFVEYVNGGCSIRVVVGIDYGASNGNPRDHLSLHYLDPEGSLNDYQKALGALVGILAKYDEDRVFPVYGFGADFDDDTSNCFQCGTTEEVSGVSGVLKSYKLPLRAPEKLAMSETSSYVEVISAAARYATTAPSSGGQSYTVLLVLTDGVGVQIPETVTALKDVIETPLSVIFVGIGEATFEEMEHLDEALKEHGRDMVSFVQFNKYRSNIRALTAATLKEIPAQLVDYFFSRGITPLPPKQVSEEDIEVEEEEEEGEANQAAVNLRFDLSGFNVSVSSVDSIE